MARICLCYGFCSCISARWQWVAVRVDMDDDTAAGRIDPLAIAIEAGAGVDGVDNFVGGGDYAFGMLDEKFEGIDGVAAAAGVEAGGAGVAVDGGGVEDAVGAGEACGAVPVEVVAFDGGEVRVAADAAFDFVVGEGRSSAGLAGWRGLLRDWRGCDCVIRLDLRLVLRLVMLGALPHVTSLVEWNSAPTDVNTVLVSWQIGTHWGGEAVSDCAVGLDGSMQHDPVR